MHVINDLSIQFYNWFAILGESGCYLGDIAEFTPSWHIFFHPLLIADSAKAKISQRIPTYIVFSRRHKKHVLLVDSKASFV